MNSPQGSSRDVMHHLDEGQGVGSGTTASAYTLGPRESKPSSHSQQLF